MFKAKSTGERHRRPTGTERVVSTARRRWLVWLGLTATLGARSLEATADDAVPSTEAMIDGFVGNRPVVEGRVVLTLPEVAENGLSVACEVQVESPMVAEDHVEALLVIAPANPNRRIATFRFSPVSGVAAVATRIRLADTQTVLAYARTNRHEVYVARRHVEVVVGGCGPTSAGAG